MRINNIKKTSQQRDTCRENSFPDGLTNCTYVSDTFRHCDTSSLTTEERSIKSSPCGSVWPRTDATARRADTHSAWVRSQAALGKKQLPERREQSRNDESSAKTTRQSVSM